MAHESPLINSSPNKNAWANPSGEGWTLYCKEIPNWCPSPNSSSKRGVSSGVEIIKNGHSLEMGQLQTRWMTAIE